MFVAHDFWLVPDHFAFFLFFFFFFFFLFGCQATKSQLYKIDFLHEIQRLA